MILKAFALLDTKTGGFGTPFFMHHTGLAIRAVSDLAQDMSTTVGRHPADFALCELGFFDDNSGVLTPCQIINHGLALSFIPQQRQATFAGFGPPPSVEMEEAMHPKANGHIPVEEA